MSKCVFSQSIKNIIYRFIHVPIDGSIFQRKIDTINRQEKWNSLVHSTKHILSKNMNCPFFHVHICLESCNRVNTFFSSSIFNKNHFVRNAGKNSRRNWMWKMKNIKWAEQKNCPIQMVLITNGNGVNLYVIDTEWRRKKKTNAKDNKLWCVTDSFYILVALCRFTSGCC